MLDPKIFIYKYSFFNAITQRNILKVAIKVAHTVRVIGGNFKVIVFSLSFENVIV